MDPFFSLVGMQEKCIEFEHLCQHVSDAAEVSKFVGGVLSHVDFGTNDEFQKSCGKNLLLAFSKKALDLYRFDVVEKLTTFAGEYGALMLFEYLILTKNTEGYQWYLRYKNMAHNFQHTIEYSQIGYTSDMGCFMVSMHLNPKMLELIKPFLNAVKRQRSYMVLKMFMAEFTTRYYNQYIHELLQSFDQTFKRLPLPIDLINVMKRYV